MWGISKNGGIEHKSALFKVYKLSFKPELVQHEFEEFSIWI